MLFKKTHTISNKI